MEKEVNSKKRRRVSSNTDSAIEILQNENQKKRREIEKNNKKTVKKNKKNIKDITGQAAKRKRMLKVCIIFVLIITAIILIKNYHKLGLVINKDITIKDAVVIPNASSNNIIKPYRDEILVYSSETYSTYNRFGKQTWKIKLDTTFVPEISTAGKYIQILNKDKGYVYVYYNKYESARIKIDGNIKSGKILEDGTSLIEYMTAGSKTVIGIYDKNGKEHYETKINSNTIGDYILSDNDRYLAYSEVVIDGISVTTNINVVDLKSAGKEDYNIPTVITKDNEIAYKMFFDGKDLITLFENEVVICNVNNKELKEYKMPQENILNIDINNKKYAYTSLDSEKESGYILAFLKFGDLESVKESIQELPINIKYQDNLLYIGGKKTVKIYNEFGVNVKNYNSETILSEPIIFNSGKSVAVPTSNKIIIFTI